ncbi:MAG: DUF523 domain-containing protein [Zetaproteobacteria bacterium]|nr:MAG: DUF523 domain-containing protein [Zetaproteobacteria bacterium]
MTRGRDGVADAVVRPRLLVSACLLGEQVRYDGRRLPVDPSIARWAAAGVVVSCCPEVAGGLPVPRPAAEIAADGAVRCRDGRNVSAPFRRGAEAALALCRRHAIRLALLQERSPSCGVSRIYDGSFSGRLVAGSGVTAALLRRHGIRVFGPHQLREVAQALQSEAG